MADGVTTNYGLTKPDVNDPAGENLWGQKLNTNFDTIDTTIKTVSDAANAKVPTTRTVSAGAGLAGGGDLSANRSFAIDKATAAQVRDSTSDKVVTGDNILSAAAFFAMTYAASQAINHNNGYNQKVTYGGNITFGAPSNAKPGFPLKIWVVPGAFTTSWNSVFKFDGATPTINAEGVVYFDCLDASNFVFLGYRKKA